MLSTPVTQRELLRGKALAAVVPAVAIAWPCSLYVGLPGSSRRQVVLPDVDPRAGRGQALLAPALALFAILVGMLISLRASDFRVAQQLAVLASLPLIGFIALVTFRALRPSAALYAGRPPPWSAVMDAICWRLCPSGCSAGNASSSRGRRRANGEPRPASQRL